jgi:GH15 family glucan-1,4-alpha-glucosidase
MCEEPSSIGDHAAIGDGRSVALVTSGGTIDWLCWPTFDAPSIFASLLDPKRGGCWHIGPTAAARRTRSYVADTNVLETRFVTPGGTLVLTDAMTVPDENARRRRIGNNHELLRRVCCEEGSVEVEVVFEPRPDFGRTLPRLRDLGVLGVRCEVGARLYALHSEHPLAVDPDRARARFTLQAGERARFALTFDDDVASLPVLGAEADARIANTAAWWRRWLAQMTYVGPDREVVARSLLAIKLLAFAPSGAVVAAPTTSLPERIGGDLNWDYRYCWLRDAAFTARAFYDSGFHDDGVAFCNWLLHTTRLTRPELRILYDVYGNLPAGEQILGHLAGYCESRPVRIRNEAARQLQLDCYGEVLDATVRLHAEEDRLDRETQRLLADLGTFVLRHWQKPDQGIWEPRGAPLHRTHSRTLCWVALDRLVKLRRRGLVPRLSLATLEAARAAIHQDVVTHAWNPTIASYSDVFGGDQIDASLLRLSWYGFEEASSPRMHATYERIESVLRAAPGLYYRNEEGLRSREGAFGICSAWVIEYLVRAGRRGEARDVFDAFVSYRNDVGLLGEEIDPHSGEALGNFPQAYTHVGVIGAALALAKPAHSMRYVGVA